MIDEFLKIAARSLDVAVFILIILVAFGTILGGKKGGMWVIGRAIWLIKAVFRANIIMLIRLGKKTCLGVGRYVYLLSKIKWMPSSRFGQQPGMRAIRIQRLSARAQDNTQERSRSLVPPDTHWE